MEKTINIRADSSRNPCPGFLDNNSTTVTTNGKTSVYVNTPDNDRRYTYWELRRFVQSELATNTSIRKCGSKCCNGSPTLNVNNTTGKSYFQNVYKCKSKICPVCQKQIAYKRIENMNKVLEHTMFKDFIFVTLTGSHDWNTNLSDFHKNMTQSFREVFRGKFKRKLKTLGYVTYIRAVDYTFSKSSKHHIHNHLVLLFSERLDKEIIQELNEELYELYSYQMKKRNVETNKSGYYFERVTSGKDTIVKYLTKAGNITLELFNNFNKINDGQMYYTIWQVLQLYKDTGDLFWKDIWTDYHSQIKNCKMVTYGAEYNKLLKEINENEDDKDENEIQELVSINPSLYETLYKYKLCIPILHSVELYFHNKRNNIENTNNERRYHLVMNGLNELNELYMEHLYNDKMKYSLFDTFRKLFYKYKYT